jgi:hypothetical protein
LQRPVTLSLADVFFLEEARRAPEVASIAMERNTAEVIRARGKKVLRGMGAGPSLAGNDTQLCI